MSVIIGIDPHKATHTAVAIDRNEQLIAKLQVVADRTTAPCLLPNGYGVDDPITGDRRH